MSSTSRFSLLFLPLLLAPCVAPASDGRIEISQTVAEEGGVNGDLVADPAGFPVVITQPGSYVLTSNLTPTDPNTHGIFLLTGNVQIDFNGFGIIGPFVPGGSIGTGAGVAGPGEQDVVVRNGFVRNMANIGISLDEGGRVIDMAVAGNADGGVAIFGDGLVEGSRIHSNSLDTGGTASFGIASGDGTVILERTSLGPSEELVQTFPSFPDGAFAFGRGNVCDDERCNSTGRRVFYLTTGTFDGAGALTACDPGFHMAARFELHDLAHLEYDNGRGFAGTPGALPDLGEGPPTEAFAWIRTGRETPNFNIGPGEENCASYTSNDPALDGTMAELVAGGSVNPAEKSSPWELSTSECNEEQLVWCIQD